MSDRTDIDFVSDIREAIRRIQDYTAGFTYDTFLADTKTHYFGVNLDIVWQVAAVELPLVVEPLAKIIDGEAP